MACRDQVAQWKSKYARVSKELVACRKELDKSKADMDKNMKENKVGRLEQPVCVFTRVLSVYMCVLTPSQT